MQEVQEWSGSQGNPGPIGFKGNVGLTGPQGPVGVKIFFQGLKGPIGSRGYRQHLAKASQGVFGR